MDFKQIGEISYEEWLNDNGYDDNDFLYGRLDSKHVDLYEEYKTEQQ